MLTRVVLPSHGPVQRESATPFEDRVIMPTAPKDSMLDDLAETVCGFIDQARPPLPIREDGSDELNIPHPDQSRDCSANRLLYFCMLWRMEDLCRLYRDRPGEFEQERDKLLGLYDVPSSMLRLMLKFGLGGPSSSASFLSKEQFRYLTEHLERACDDRGIGSGAIFDFGNYAEADLKAATRELDRLERQLRRELSQEPSPPSEDGDAEPDEPPGGQPEEDQTDAGDAVSIGAPPSEQPAEPQLGAVEQSKMRVYTLSGWVEVSRPKLLDAIEALTREKGAWLVNWKCFGTDANTNARLNKELANVPPAISRHIESGSNGYRWIDSPATSKKRRKAKPAS